MGLEPKQHQDLQGFLGTTDEISAGLDCVAFERVEVSHPWLENHQNTMKYIGNMNMVSQNLKNGNTLFKI